MKIKTRPATRRWTVSLDISGDELYTLISMTEFVGRRASNVSEEETLLAQQLHGQLQKLAEIG